MKKIIIGIVVIVIIAVVSVVAVVMLKKEKTQALTFTSPDGLYSLEYPVGWTKTGEAEGGVLFVNNDQRVSISIDYEGIFLTMLTKGIQLKKGESMTVDSHEVTTYSASQEVEGKTIYATIQVVSLGQASTSLLFTVTGTDPKLGTELVKTLTVNEEKVANASSVILQAIVDARKKGADAQIKSALAAIRSSAELYYEKSKTYAGVCKSDTSVASTVKNLKDAGVAEVDCKDAKAAYAVTAKLITEGYFCVDSTGYAGAGKGMNTGTVCLK